MFFPFCCVTRTGEMKGTRTGRKHDATQTDVESTQRKKRFFFFFSPPLSSSSRHDNERRCAQNKQKRLFRCVSSASNGEGPLAELPIGALHHRHGTSAPPSGAVRSGRSSSSARRDAGGPLVLPGERAGHRPGGWEHRCYRWMR